VNTLDGAVPLLGRKIFDALRHEDVLTQGDGSGGVTYANPQLGDRLTAVWLTGRLRDGVDVLSEMRPGLDDSPMIALLRGALSDTVQDLVGWCEEVLAKSGEWLPAVAEGIAQHGSDDWRTIAAITSWANRSERFATWHAMRALGGMAGSSGRVRYWIASLYADEHHRQHFKGEIALGRALETIPRWVERRIRLRLRRDLLREAKWQTDDRQRVRFLRSALEPLRFVTHSDSAAVGRAISTWIRKKYASSRRKERTAIPSELAQRLDSLRGRVALYGPRTEVEGILKELESTDDETRLSAARALLPISEESSNAVLEVLLKRLRIEENRLVLLSLLQSLYSYLRTNTPETLAALTEPEIVARLGPTGSVLGLLADAVSKDPRKVKEALLSLPQIDPQEAVWHRELLPGRCTPAPSPPTGMPDPHCSGFRLPIIPI
jgi:hypothetical protein